MITCYFTDGSLTPIGQPIVDFIQLTATLTRNDRASVQLQVPALSQYRDLALPGNRLVVMRNKHVFVGGPIEVPAAFSRSADPSSAAASPGVLTIASTDDGIWLDRRVTYPDPAHASTAQTTDFYTLSATNGEVALRDLFYSNVGVGALTARQVPNMILGSLATVGSNINIRTRFDILGDQMRAAALAAGDLGVQIVQDGTDLKFLVSAPEDLSAEVRFSWPLANMRSVDFQWQAPGSTVAIVGGDGTGTSRTMAERADSAGESMWGRIETFVNETSSDTTDLNQAGDTALAGAVQQFQLTADVVDTPSCAFGVHYGLGSIVSVEPYSGLQIVDMVRAVTLTVTPATGEVITPQIGTASMSTVPKIVQVQRAQNRRIAILERA